MEKITIKETVRTYNGVEITSGECKTCKYTTDDILPDGNCIDCYEDKEDEANQ